MSIAAVRYETVLTGVRTAILKTLWPRGPTLPDIRGYERNSELVTLMPENFVKAIEDKVVIDFGCGTGSDAVEMALMGAKRVIGVDIRQEFLAVARERAAGAGVKDICEFASSTQEIVDIIISVDAFEHFSDPAAVLRCMSHMLKPGGEVFISFGPTWYHPFGGHLFSVFPWAHLVFGEKALIGWRSSFKTDGATRFSEVAGGLNQMTISKFEKLIGVSPLRFASFELVPIKKLRAFHNRLTREFLTAVVSCRLVKT